MTAPAASFRDPAGTCWQIEQRIIRILDKDRAKDCEDLLATQAFRELVGGGQLVTTRRLEAHEICSLTAMGEGNGLPEFEEAQAVFEHERIPFASYPYEWPPEMLWEAGRLTLGLARRALTVGYGLKDATPYNILFRGPAPVFVDLPSFEPRDPNDPVWRAYGQFIRTFLLPLAVNRHWGTRLADIFITRRDGLEPEEVYSWCGFWQRLRPPFLSLVSLPTWLTGKAQAKGEKLYQSRGLADREKARFIVDSLLAGLERRLSQLRPNVRKSSQWTSYMASHSYGEPAFKAKEQFVADWVAEFRPNRVLDVGANTGHFSLLAARSGARVVAVDSDPACAGMIWEQAIEQKLDVMPLVVDISRPSPALGWDNRECASFLERARGGFDCVLMLGLIHHLLVTERVPLKEVLRLAAELTTATLVVEFVAPEDEMFRHLTRGRERLHDGLTKAVFEEACAEHFTIVRSLALPGTHRHLFGLRKRGAVC